MSLARCRVASTPLTLESARRFWSTAAQSTEDYRHTSRTAFQDLAARVLRRIAPQKILFSYHGAWSLVGLQGTFLVCVVGRGLAPCTRVRANRSARILPNHESMRTNRTMPRKTLLIVVWIVVMLSLHKRFLDSEKGAIRYSQYSSRSLSVHTLEAITKYRRDCAGTNRGIMHNICLYLPICFCSAAHWTDQIPVSCPELGIWSGER